MNHSLTEEIIKMAKEDKRAIAESSNFKEHGVGEIKFTKHAARLGEIVKNFGWPTPALVGHQASEDALLIVMNSDDKEFQRECLAAMKREYEANSHPLLLASVNKLSAHLHM